MTVQTAPRAECDIEVVYNSGPSTAQGLRPKQANREGRVSWEWMVGTRTALGTYPIYIECETADDWEMITLQFRVAR